MSCWLELAPPTRPRCYSQRQGRPAAMIGEAAPVRETAAYRLILSLSTPTIRHGGIRGWVLSTIASHGPQITRFSNRPIQNGSGCEIGQPAFLLVEHQVLSRGAEPMWFDAQRPG